MYFNVSLTHHMLYIHSHINASHESFLNLSAPLLLSFLSLLLLLSPIQVQNTGMLLQWESQWLTIVVLSMNIHDSSNHGTEAKTALSHGSSVLRLPGLSASLPVLFSLQHMSAASHCSPSHTYITCTYMCKIAKLYKYAYLFFHK